MGTRKTSALVHARECVTSNYGWRLWQGRDRVKKSPTEGANVQGSRMESAAGNARGIERSEKNSGETGPFAGSRQHLSLAFRQRFIKGVGDHVEELGREPFGEKREVVEVRVLLWVQMPRRHLLVEDRRR